MTKMLLVVYVDDMKLSGPKDKMKETWKALSQNLNLEEPKGDVTGTHTFLGCIHKRSSKIVNGVKVETMEYDVKASVKKAVDKYKEAVYEITGKEPMIWKADTPFLHDETKSSPLRKPCKPGPFVECPSCLHTISLDDIPSLTHQEGEKRKVQDIMKVVSKETMEQDDRYADLTDDEASTSCGSRTPDLSEDESDSNWDNESDSDVDDWGASLLPNIKAKMIEEHGICQVQARRKGRNQGKVKEEPRKKEAMFKASDKSRRADDPGTLGGIAAMMLMTILYAARVARSDLLRAISFLAKRITRWDHRCDQRLHRLICYLDTTCENQLVG